MQSQTWRRKAWLPILLSVGLITAACGDDEETDTGGGGGEGAAPEGDFSGEEIQISGSSTVEPITAIVAEEFDAATGASTFVDGPGTGDGFAAFCEGDIDISDASRAIEAEEQTTCEQNSIEYIELYIGIDGMAVMTNPNNDQVECLSFADLYAMISSEADGFENWSDAQELADELGSETELPDAPLDLYGPGPESGTYDSFIEIALEGIGEERDQEEVTTREDYSQNADDNQIVAGIEGSDTSLGWVGYSYAAGVGDSVRSIPISEEPGGDCVEPSPETIADGSYPLSRPLYIYVNAARAEESEALSAFVDFYLSDLATWVEEAGYVAIPDEDLQATTEAWEGR